MSKALLICDVAKGIEYFTRILSENDYDDVIVAGSGEEAKRMLVENDYDICLVNAPLQSGSGEQLAIDIAEKNICQVLLFVRAEHQEEITERVENYGVITVGKPINRQMFWSALKLAKVAQRRIQMAQKETQKLKNQIDGLKLVSRAKCLLISYEGLTEEEAHKKIERWAMDERTSRTEIAREIILRYG